ncbi:MAG TPA: GIY-YIG nuclease family protein, partial [Pirellulales bacterium]
MKRQRNHKSKPPKSSDSANSPSDESLSSAASNDAFETPGFSGGFEAALAKVRNFPTTSGVYLMKDSAGRVIYVGKAKNLKARAGSYFLKAAALDRRTAELVREIHDIDFLDAESEVDALLVEARLVKDIQPKYNQELKDDKTFPYLEIYNREDFPRVEFTREPKSRGTKLYGPFASAGGLRGALQVLQKIFK